MKREKSEMCKVVQETLLRRSDEYIGNVIDMTYDSMREWKAKAPCSLCEFLFPPAQLLGSITLHSVRKWKESRQVPDPLSVAKSSVNNVYEKVKLCVFCTQFFDSNFSNTFDVESEANRDLKTHLLMSRRAGETRHSDSMDGSGLHKMKIGVAIAELYLRKQGALKARSIEVMHVPLLFFLFPICSHYNMYSLVIYTL
jgi:hypothetical protein